MNEPIRILCVFSTLDRGGAETMCMNLYRFIDREIIQFDFVKHSPNIGDYEKEIITLGGRIFEAPGFNGYNILQYSIWWIKFFSTHPEYKIVHGHFFTLSSIYFYFAKKYKRITIGHIHASGIKGRFKQYLVTRIEDYSDYCIACSKEAGEWAYPHKDFIVLKNAVNSEQFKYNAEKRSLLRKKYNLENYLVLGTVANFSGVKNPLGLLEIYSEIHKNSSKSILLWIGEGRQRPLIESTIESYGLKDNVILLGKRNDVPDLLQMMDCFLLPSFKEGLPVSAIEAQAAGLPCFISDSVTKDVDITGLCSFLPIDNVDVWKRAIVSLDYERKDTSEIIKKAGYDILETAVWLQNYYLSILKT